MYIYYTKLYLGSKPKRIGPFVIIGSAGSPFWVQNKILLFIISLPSFLIEYINALQFSGLILRATSDGQNVLFFPRLQANSNNRERIN